MAYVVLAKWTARGGEEERVRDALAKLIAPSRAEPGCIAYQPLRQIDDPSVFIIYEHYVDAAAYDAHSATRHFHRHAVEEGIPLLEGRERQFLETVDPDGPVPAPRDIDNP